MKEYGARMDYENGTRVFMDAEEISRLLAEGLDWSWSKGGLWTTATEIAKHLGLKPTQPIVTTIGINIEKFAKVKKRKSNGRNLIYVPRP